MQKNVFFSLIFSFFISSSLLAIQIPVFAVEYAAILKANKSFLDYQLSDKAKPEVASGAYGFCVLADACRLIEKIYFAITDDEITSRQRFSRWDGIMYRGGTIYESGMKYALSWLVFDFVSLVYHLRKRLDFKHEEFIKKRDAFIKAFEEGLDEGYVRESISNEITADNLSDPDESADDNQKNKIMFIKAFAIYILPLAEVACACAYSLSTSDISYGGSAFRAKLNAIQSMIQLVTEILMCEKISKMIWVYSCLIGVAVFALLSDLNIGKMERMLEAQKIQEQGLAFERFAREYERLAHERDDLLRMQDEARIIDEAEQRKRVAQVQERDVPEKLMEIPRFYYAEDHSECSICLNAFEDAASLVVLPCGHILHDSKDCCGLLKHDQCPICGHTFTPNEKIKTDLTHIKAAEESKPQKK